MFHQTMNEYRVKKNAESTKVFYFSKSLNFKPLKIPDFSAIVVKLYIFNFFSCKGPTDSRENKYVSHKEKEKSEQKGISIV